MLSETSCSDCKLEFIHRNWSKLLLKWINRCVNKKDQNTRIRRLSMKCLSDIMTKYKKDVCDNDMDRAMLCSDDMEPFIKYKYPILRLRYLTEETDQPKKLYIMTSILLYHCCVKSRSGMVHEDIFRHLKKYEQELILKYCEKLKEMETTINNIESAIQDAFETVFKEDNVPSKEPPFDIEEQKSSDTAAQMSSSSTVKSSLASLPSDPIMIEGNRVPPSKFTSSITVLPSVVTDTSTYSDVIEESDNDDRTVAEKDVYVDSDEINLYMQDKFKINEDERDENIQRLQMDHRKKEKEEPVVLRQSNFDRIGENVTLKKTSPGDKTEEFQATHSKNPRCLPDCWCKKCCDAGPCCGDPGSPKSNALEKKPLGPEDSKQAKLRFNRKLTALLIAITLFIILVAVLPEIVPLFYKAKREAMHTVRVLRYAQEGPNKQILWKCKNNLCQKIYHTQDDNDDIIYQSHSECTLICTGPQIWPLPIGKTAFSRTIVTLATNKLEHKLQNIPSDNVHRHLAEAFKLFIADLVELENKGQKFKNNNVDVKKMKIQIDVESDPDPRVKLNTEEAYQLKIETIQNQVVIKISSQSFCGVRHGLETLTQMILLDDNSGHLITVANADIKDAPSFKYRGLMIDTGRNYIPVQDLMRTVDAMATIKLNTFHWRISDVTSFPLYLPRVPQLFEHGAYDRSMNYTKDDIMTLVKRAGVRGIRVLMEIAAPGPVGRPWSWIPGAICPSKNNDTCDNILCLRLDTQESVLDVLQVLYEEVLEMTKVDDIFHLSNGIFSLSNCFNLFNNRDGFLDKALDRLKLANKGFLPKLPIIWYTSHLTNDFESKTWERFGVQLDEWKPNPTENFMSKFKVVHSSKWDLSCEIKKQRCKKYRNWQEMYAWKSWRNVETFTVEGGEALLWTDLVDSGNLDYHLWPRAAAVAERLWSDIVANNTADGSVYVRLNRHRSRMLRNGVKVQPIWPAWCFYNPEQCLKKVL